MGRLFGTDGIRGIAGEGLTAEMAYKLGLAVASVLRSTDDAKGKVLIGKDTRISGDMFEAAITAGLCAAGCNAVSLGVVPTPAVAFLVRQLGADAGIMISASHNKSEYNGIKVFSGLGYKLDDEKEHQVEEIILGHAEATLCSGAGIGKICYEETALERYCAHVRALLPQEGVKGRRILLDLANGSATATAKSIFVSNDTYEFDFMSDRPDGININERCGSTELHALSQAVCAGKYDLGIAFDGDADRCLCVDQNGNTIDGDRILSLFALDMKRRGVLRNNTLVVTCLSNLGVFRMAEKNQIDIETTSVGDRYVLECMLKGNFSVGGEQSGHIILSDYATTGDGQMTAAKILSIMSQTKAEASEIFSVMEPLPQVAINVCATDAQKKRMNQCERLTAALEDVRAKLGRRGRVLLRPSGTEALIRIMLEGENISEIQQYGEELAQIVKEL